MSVFSCRLTLSLVICLVATLAIAQSEQKDGRYYEGLARKAYQEKNYGAFLDSMKLAAELRPNHPRLMYNLAVAYALNNQPKDACALLRRTAEMGLVFAPASDHDFDSLHSSADFNEVVKQFEKNKMTLNGLRRIPK